MSSANDSIEISVTADLYLRSVQVQDAIVLYQLIEKNKDQLRLYFNWTESLLKSGDITDFINAALQQVRDYKGITWLVIYQEEVIGSVVLYDWIHDVNKISLGFWIDGRYQRQGIMTRCITRVLEYLFQDLGVRKVEMYFSPANAASRRLSEIFGFTLEGLLRRSFYINGNREDQYMAGLLYHEWSARPAR